jgi:RNA 2',3'-cyclic 3'-phosphodiesterase
MPRYFVAIPLPIEARDRLIAVQPPAIPGMRILPREEFHLTLHFLGELAPHDFDAVRSASAMGRVEVFAVSLKGIGQFPSERHAKVLWAGVEPNAELFALHRSIATVLADGIGFCPEERPYSAHVTLARLDEPAPTGVIEQYLERQQEFEMRAVPLDRFILYSNSIAENVPKYQEEAVFRLEHETASTAEQRE